MDVLHQTTKKTKKIELGGQLLPHVDAELSLGSGSAVLSRSSGGEVLEAASRASLLPLGRKNCMENLNPWPGGIGFSAADGDRKRKREWAASKGVVVDSAQLVATKVNEPCIELRHQEPLPPGWEQCLDLQSGEMYYVDLATQTRTCDDPRKSFHPHHLPSTAPQLWRSHSCKENLFQRSNLSAVAGYSERELHHKLPARGLDLEMRLLSSPASSMKSSASSNELRDLCGLRSNKFSNSTFDIDQSNHQKSSGLIQPRTQAADASSNMVAMVCLHCHTFVMISKACPECPNCRSLCIV